MKGSTETEMFQNLRKRGGQSISTATVEIDLTTNMLGIS